MKLPAWHYTSVTTRFVIAITYLRLLTPSLK